LIGLAAGYRIVDRIEDALAAVAEAEPMAEYAQQSLDLARIHHLRGNLYFPLGNLQGCLSEHEKALKFAEMCGSAHYTARALGGIGDAYYALGRMETAHGYFERCIDLCRVNGFGSIEVAYLIMQFDTHFFRGNLPQVFADCEKAIEMATRVGNRRAEFFNHWNHIFYSLELHCGADAAAKRSLAAARNLVEQLGLRRCEPFVIMASCKVNAVERQPCDVEAELRRAYAICQETGVTFAGPWVLGMLASLTKNPEARDWALREGQRVLSEQVCVSHNYIYFYRYAMDALLAARLWAEAERYALQLEEYTHPEPLPVCDFFVARARALSAFGRGQQDGALVRELRRLIDEAKRMGLNSNLPPLQEALNAAEELRIVADLC
jgi:tetratricopeptide (TPR) repeat protein